ncbi:MAG TPA: hypothetical protein VK034_06245 [Enhygromyxa sp.]|nr:hypothetical protein [Enhygromyxa sp.]
MLGLSNCTPAQDGHDAAPEADESNSPTYTYWRDAKAVLDHKCANCHVAGDIAPFALTSYAEVTAMAPILPLAIEAGTMPPWPPGDGCQDYRHDRSLADDERELLLTWLAEGAPEGDPADQPSGGDQHSAIEFSPDVTLTMLEPYTPTKAPDDYRCFVIPWDGPEPWVTGFRVVPDQRSVVHHVIAFAIDPDAVGTVEALDAAEPGPGYTCFGDAGVLDARWVGSWAPGGRAKMFPEGTGVRLEPGSRVVLQVHYNTSASGPIADQSAIELSLADAVERPLVNQPVLDLGWVLGYRPMTIPAGDPDVTHSTEINLGSPLWAFALAEAGVGEGDDLLVHASALHMHQLGVRARLTVIRGSAEPQCVLDIPRWDFSWQDGYELVEPIRIHSGDKIGLQCWWDNSAENQPIIDGQPAEPVDVAWGEGTRDEMCLGILALTRAD